MTIGDKLRRDQPEVWARLLIDYNLVEKYYPAEKRKEIVDLMRPGAYTGKVERRRGAMVQRHRGVLK